MRKGDAKRDQIGNGTEPVGLTANMFGEEEEHGRRLLWRLGTWAIATVLAVGVAAWINNASTGLRRERFAYAELSRQAQQLEMTAKNAQDETKRLSSAVSVLNNDRDRLYTRVTSIEQGLDSVTGSIAKQASSLSWPTLPATPVVLTPPVISGVATSAASGPDEATTVRPHDSGAEHKDVASKEQAATAPPPPPNTMSAKLTETTAAAPPARDQKAELQPLAKPQPIAAIPPSTPSVPAPPALTTSSVQRTDFAVDLGAANSIEGLRALWRSSLKGWPALVSSLTPLIVIKEGHDGLGLRLHLVAGPIQDAAAAAKLCASLIANRHGCETTVFDGQLLAVNAAPATAASVPTREKSRRKSRAQAEKPVEEPQRPQPTQQPPPQPQQQQSSGALSIFGSR